MTRILSVGDRLERVVETESLPIAREAGADRRGEECSHSAVPEVLGHPHVALLAPARPPAVLDRPEPAQLVLNTIVT